MLAGLVLADQPGAWTTFTFDGREVRARSDPMWMGWECLSEILDKPQHVRRLFDQHSQMMLTFADPFGAKLPILLREYLGSVGLSLERLGVLLHALERVEDLEVDLLRMGLDVRDWLTPEGALSSRRVALIVEDLLDRPESRIGAAHMDISPADKAAIGIAQYLSGESHRHRFLWSPEELEKDAKCQREEAEKMERIAARNQQN
ncbi:hypothetical protein ACEN2D_02185 [Corynebacterium auriscanis]|uniref:hypothetical protein n=1 Tax=Corynebacterium TaxID=1716 RepID=UPI0008A1B303|nr:hypothetical protein [Corynebacterium sp. HMSC28B08]OFT91387.1 hypothetical protein HMPREF3098_01115 [Corynebacterium sp. HMSC28B08]